MKQEPIDAPKFSVKTHKPGEFEWATYIEGRNTPFKIHRTLGHARAALTTYAYMYGRDHRQVVRCDMVLYHAEGTEWIPKFQATQGSPFTHFPWHEPPPPPEVQAREEAYGRMDSYLSSVITTAERELTGEVQERVLTKLREARDEVLKIIQES